MELFIIFTPEDPEKFADAVKACGAYGALRTHHGAGIKIIFGSLLTNEPKFAIIIYSSLEDVYPFSMVRAGVSHPKPEVAMRRYLNCHSY